MFLLKLVNLLTFSKYNVKSLALKFSSHDDMQPTFFFVVVPPTDIVTCSEYTIDMLKCYCTGELLS